jgi:SAM-dependent methyltransferase
MEESQINRAWWKEFYEDTPFESYLRRSNKQDLDDVVEFLWQKLKLSPGAQVFDQCCGVGSVSLALARRGVSVVGVDLCGKYIEEATGEATKSKLNCRFDVGDAYEYVATPACDAAFNWWTSFGYALEDEDNIKMLQCVYKSLKPGGLFCLDYPNVSYLLRHLKESETIKLDDLGSEVIVLRETIMDLIEGLRRQKWTFTLADGRQTIHDTWLRLYLPDQLAKLLRRSGFDDIKFFGGVSGGFSCGLKNPPLGIDSPRCLVTAKRS